MLIAFLQDYAGKRAGQVCDMDANVANGLLMRKIVKKVEKEGEKKLAPSSIPEPKKAGRPKK